MARQTHAFSVEYAELYGVECAILINHFQFWIEQNQAMGRNFHDGHTWMYQTQQEISSIYPYWSEDTIFRLIKKLVDAEVLIKGNYNKNSYDRTVWYAFKNEKMFTKPQNRGMLDEKPPAKSRNGNCEVAEPIPDTNPVAKEEQQQGACAPAAASPKKSKDFIYRSLMLLNILKKEKIWITAKYDEDTVNKAVLWATSDQTKISTTLVQAIKWACLNQPEIPTDPKVQFDANKRYAKLYDMRENNIARVDALSKGIEIVVKLGQKQPIFIDYEENDFKKKLDSELIKYNISLMDDEILKVFAQFS